LLFVPYVTGGLKELLFSEIIFPSKFALDIFFLKKMRDLLLGLFPGLESHVLPDHVRSGQTSKSAKRRSAA